MKKIKRFLALFLSISILVTMALSSGIGVLATENTPVTGTVFSDNFSDSEYTAANWSNPNRMTVNGDGTVTAIAGTTTSPKNSLTWSEYMVEADVKFTPTAKGHFVGLVGYGQALNGGNGYEFGLYSSSSETDIRAKLFTRGAGTNTYTTNAKSEFAVDTWYHLTIIVDGSTIRCYIDGTLRFDVENATFSCGCPSIRCLGSAGTFDNFKVSEICMFTDDFSYSKCTQANWSNPNQMTVNDDGTVTVALGRITSPKDSLTWSKYMVEADVKFTPTAKAHFAGLVGYGQGINGGNGYEFGLCSSTSETDIRAKLYTRGAGNQNYITSVKSEFAADTWYHLTMIVDGSTIRCYIDGTLRFNVENATFSSGCPSIKCLGSAGTFDNFKVSKIYNILSITDGNGSLQLDDDIAKKGSIETITAVPEAGYHVSNISSSDVELVKTARNYYSFTMPASDVSLTVTFAPILKGDINEDGTLNDDDMVLIRNILLDIRQVLDDYETFAADVNSTNTLDVCDLVALKKACAS